MEYEEAVKQGREAARSQWTLGDLALTIETEYGEGTLQQFADDIGVEYRTLDDYRRVAAAYEIPERSGNLPWSVHQIFASQEDRAKLVRRRWTAKVAREEIQARADRAHKEEERRKINARTFAEYYDQMATWLGMVKDFADWSPEQRGRMADLLELAVKEFRS